MDWDGAIRRNREALLRVVSMLFAASGLVPGQPAALSRATRSALLYSLLPAESALRRLIFALAQKLNVTLRKRRAGTFKPIPQAGGSRPPVFALFDPRSRVLVGADAPQALRFAKGPGPRIFFFNEADPIMGPAVESPKTSLDDPIDATRLCRRLQALKAALDDLPKQAMRMARAQARRKLAPPGPRRVPPMRPGRPPGYRARGRYEVDELLRDCHALALFAPSPPDTS